VVKQVEDARLSSSKDGNDDDLGGSRSRSVTSRWPGPQRFRYALRGSVVTGAGVSCVPLALVLSQHPLAAAGPKEGAMLWKTLEAVLGGVEGQLDDVSVEVSDEVLQACGAEASMHRQAGYGALVLLAKHMGEEGLALLNDSIVPALGIQLQRPEIVNVTQLEEDIYFHSPLTPFQVSQAAARRMELWPP
jgi:hypothetical protein